MSFSDWLDKQLHPSKKPVKKRRGTSIGPGRINQVQITADDSSMAMQSGGNITVRGGSIAVSNGRQSKIHINGVDFEYDLAHDMIYVKLPAFRKAYSSLTTKTVSEDPLVNLDINDKGIVVGVEIEVRR